MKKKKILFILYNMSCGGPQRSLLNLLFNLDPEIYSVDLLLFQKKGLLLNDIPDFVTVKGIRPQGLYCSFKTNPISFLGFIILRAVVKGFLLLFIRNNRQRQENVIWLTRSLFIKKSNIEYDLAMAYSEGAVIKYLATKVKANTKIGRIPTDYKSANLDRNIDYKYFEKMDFLFVVSKGNQDILANIFPEFRKRIMVFRSIFSPSIIKDEANKGIGFNDNFSGIRILTIARYDKAKGIDLAMETCALLKQHNINARWYFLGKGHAEDYNSKIDVLGIDNNFKLLGETTNPYRYLKEADIYIQPSKYEGMSNSVNEAKALGKRIIITNFSTASDHLVNNEDGIIVEMNALCIYNAIVSLIRDPSLGEYLSNNLLKKTIGNEFEVSVMLNLMK